MTTDPSHVAAENRRKLRVAVACDHRGYAGKRKLLPFLQKLGHEVIDHGCHDQCAVDYPDFAAPPCHALIRGEADVAILLDGSGIGMSIVANKICGVRAATVHDELTARVAREHNGCNVLCLGTDLVGDVHMHSIVETFLAANYQGGRHDRRLKKITCIEASFERPSGDG